MPYLHLDLPLAVAPADRAEIAARLARTYADVMETNPERVTIAFRELGENGVVRLRPDGALETVVMVNCDIRRRRAPEQRERRGVERAARPPRLRSGPRRRGRDTAGGRQPGARPARDHDRRRQRDARQGHVQRAS